MKTQLLNTYTESEIELFSCYKSAVFLVAEKKLLSARALFVLKFDITLLCLVLWYTQGRQSKGSYPLPEGSKGANVPLSRE